MNQPALANSWKQPMIGWDEPQQASWKIEQPEALVEDFVEFFPGQSGRVYEQLLYNLPVLLHCMDGMGRIMSANKYWSDAFGYKREEIEGKPFPDFLTPESRTHLVQSIYPRFFQQGQIRNEEVTVLRKDGTHATVVLAMNAYRGDKGRIERSICVLQDVTARRIAEAASKRSEQRFRGAFESAANGMALLSPSGDILMANCAFKVFLARPEKDYDAMLFDDLLVEGDRRGFQAELKRVLSGELPALKQELRYGGKDGQIVHALTSIAPVRNEAKIIEQLVVQIADASERKGAEMQLQKAQKMEAIGQLTGGIAHDFNNLLTIIMGNLQLIDNAVHGNDKASKRVSEAIDAAIKGSELTRQLLAYSRRQTLEPREVNVNTLVQGMAPLVSRSIGETVRVKIDLMDGEPKAVIDPSQLESTILNLAINARDAMPEGGMLAIETQPAYLDEAYCTQYPEVTPGHYLMVAVSDTGTGIPAELIEKVFQPFFTTKEPGKGSGLGLSMVYGFIKQSGGHIQVYSEIGHGTSIKMYLPRKFAPGETIPQIAPVMLPGAQPETSKESGAPKAKILVVEDQEGVREVACGFLSSFGYELIEAADGFQALARLQEHDDIDLMFSDVVMPGGMNGFDLAQAALSIRPALKIVHTSGYPKGAMVHQEEPRFRDGFIIMKPYRREELEKIIADALARKE